MKHEQRKIWLKKNWSKLLFTVGILLLFAIFVNQDRQKIQRSYNLPTATEVFRLRSKCATLSQKILDNNTVGSALSQSQVSHYNPVTNRCYVELTVQSADLSGYYLANYLSDGQTGDLLAFASKKGDKEYGNIYGGPVKTSVSEPSETTFQSTNDYINEVMGDDWTK